MTDTNDSNEEMFADLNGKLDVPLTDWEPTTEGDRIVGLVSAVEYVSTNSGEPMGILTLTTPSGALARVAAGAKNLRNQLEAAKVQPGDGLAVQYQGEKPGKNGGRNWNAYRIAHQAVGKRNPAAAFKVPASVVEDDLIPEAADDPWAKEQDGTREAPF